MSSLLISIITPSYNRADLIAEALQSVRIQGYASLEHIVVDGGSTDGTRELLAKDPGLRYVSEPDRGMYDALNKGLKMARGEIVGFLNTDDVYAGEILSVVAGRFAESGAEAVAGRAVYFRGDRPDSFFRPSAYLTGRNLWHEIIYGDPAFNAWFFRRRVFDQIGDFDVTYQIAGDRDFLIRFALSGLPYVSLRNVIYHYRSHQQSLSLSANLRQFSDVADENLRWVEHYWSSVPAGARSDLRRVRTRDTITAASRNLRAGAWHRALHYARLGCGFDPLWPVKFSLRLFTGIFRAIGRRLGLYPPI